MEYAEKNYTYFSRFPVILTKPCGSGRNLCEKRLQFLYKNDKMWYTESE